MYLLRRERSSFRRIILGLWIYLINWMLDHLGEFYACGRVWCYGYTLSCYSSSFHKSRHFGTLTCSSQQIPTHCNTKSWPISWHDERWTSAEWNLCETKLLGYTEYLIGLTCLGTEISSANCSEYFWCMLIMMSSLLTELNPCLSKVAGALRQSQRN